MGINGFAGPVENLDLISTHDRTQMTKEKALVTPRHSLNAFSKPRPCRTLKLVDASRRRLSILFMVFGKIEIYRTPLSEAVESVVQPGPVSLLLVKV